MSDLTITHTPIGGTQLTGSSKGDGINVLLRGCPGPWRWAPSVDAFLIQRSRDQRVPKRHAIDVTVERLRAAGHTVTVDIDTDGPARSVAEVEEDRAARAAGRVERFTERAETRAAESAETRQRYRDMLDRIPLGQPILVGHHSEGRHRRYLARIDSLVRKTAEAYERGQHAAHRAKSAADGQAFRESGPTTMRRIERLETQLREIARKLDGTTRHAGTPYAHEEAPAAGQYRDDLEVRQDELVDQVVYWRAHLDALAEAGVYRVWTPADFEKGDLVKHRGSWSEVLRVNKKSLTIPHILPELAAHGRTWTLPYDEVRERVSKADAEAARAKRAEDAEPVPAQ